jgi:urea transporter
MLGNLTAGIIMGLLLYAAKMGTVGLIKRAMPFLKPLLNCTFGLLIIDLGVGYLGTSTLNNIGCTGLTAGFILITYMFLTFINIYSKIYFRKAKQLCSSYL